jgi:hypothetical protein
MNHMTVVVLIAWLFSPLNQQPVFDLSDRGCQNEVLIAIIEDAHVFASCASDGDERIMEVSVTNLAGAGEGPLRVVAIGFCGPSVIQASGPPGWVAKIEGDERQSVTWSLHDNLVDTLGFPSGAAASGFLVRLKADWGLSRSVSARWGNSDVRHILWTHDCPDI